MFHTGDTIGPYILMRTLGHGAFGEVWLAERRSSLLTTQVALKMPMIAENEVETVRLEAALWLRASGHPNIVPVMEAEVYDGQVVIASEFIAGGTLHEWMQSHDGKAPSINEAVSITNGILAGLDYLHRAGLTHGDLKPENVLLQDGIPRLTDFGLARVLKTDGQTSTISGSPRYMSPESFSGFYSAESDLWAIGVILQELLTGVHPFPVQEMMALIVAIQSQEPEELPDAIPERLRAIVTRLLAKSPSERFNSASAVREALQNYLQPVSVRVGVKIATALPPHNLPVQPTSFIGREKQIAEVKTLLENTHLLTLTGSGGCGKSRLALKVAEDILEQFPDGVCLVELAPLTDAALVPNTVANALRIKETAGETISQTLLAGVKGKRLLLVFDNCEHLLEASARLVDSILKSCPDVKLLVTSREALGIAGESAYRVPSLSLPDPKQPLTPDSLSQYEAVRLFIERAVAAKTAFVVTNENAPILARVCHRLDGIPLAIELAAARIRSMTLEELGHRLDDRFRILTGGSRTALPRQQTLRAMIQWSNDLLEEDQKSLLARLSVFMGGWTLEAAENVCAGGGIEAWEVLDLLTALDDKSLVMAEERGATTRYRLLETVRQYAQERLAESEDNKLYRSQHCDWFLSFAEEIRPKLHGPKQVHWLNVLETEHDNFRAALDFCREEVNRGETGLRLSGALQRFWEPRGHLTEGRERFAIALAHPGAQEPTKARADTLVGAGNLALHQGDYVAARALYEESRMLARALNHQSSLIDSISNLGLIAQEQGDHTTARTAFEECLAMDRESGNRRNIADSLANLGSVFVALEDYDKARSLIEESITIYREVGDFRALANALMNLAELDHRVGNISLAAAHVRECLKLCQELGDLRLAAGVLEIVSRLAQANKQLERAASLLGTATALRESLGAPLPLNQRREFDQIQLELRAAMGEEAFDAAWAEGRAMSTEQAVRYALEEPGDG